MAMRGMTPDSRRSCGSCVAAEPTRVGACVASLARDPRGYAASRRYATVGSVLLGAFNP